MRWVRRAGAVSLTLCAFVAVCLSTVAITQQRTRRRAEYCENHGG